MQSNNGRESGNRRDSDSEGGVAVETENLEVEVEAVVVLSVVVKLSANTVLKGMSTSDAKAEMVETIARREMW